MKTLIVSKEITEKTQWEKDHNLIITIEGIKLNDKNIDYHIGCLIGQVEKEAVEKERKELIDKILKIHEKFSNEYGSWVQYDENFKKELEGLKQKSEELK